MIFIGNASVETRRCDNNKGPTLSRFPIVTSRSGLIQRRVVATGRTLGVVNGLHFRVKHFRVGARAHFDAF